MAFDLVHYFNDQIRIQKPELLNQYTSNQKNIYIQELNCLSLGKLVSSLRDDEYILYKEIHQVNDLYIQEISRHLTTSYSNESTLNKIELESSLTDIVSLQITELKQLDETGSLGQNGIKELLLGQIKYLSGQADDWVWTTNNLIELKGTKPIPVEEISLEDTVKEFNQMISQDQVHAVVAEEAIETKVPTWAKVVEPIVALAILWILAKALCAVFA